MTIRVGHLYPEYLNIYADRGNIAVLSRRAAWRGHDLEVQALGMGDPVVPGAHDLLYVGGGQDREQALVSRDIAGKSEALRDAVEGGAAVLAGLRIIDSSPRWGAILIGVGAVAGALVIFWTVIVIVVALTVAVLAVVYARRLAAPPSTASDTRA